jgi:hypothetical protein
VAVYNATGTSYYVYQEPATLFTWTITPTMATGAGYACQRAATTFGGRTWEASDLTYRYTLPTVRKIDLEVRWSNIFDMRQYQYGFVSQFTLVQSTYQLRPAQVLASVRLSR